MELEKKRKTIAGIVCIFSVPVITLPVLGFIWDHLSEALAATSIISLVLATIATWLCFAIKLDW